MQVLVLDKKKKPLMPCHPARARELLREGRARVHRMVPFTIRLVDRLVEDSVLQPIRIKLDPGSKTTGFAIVREDGKVDNSTGEIIRIAIVLALLELKHRGHAIRDALTGRSGHRRFRRSKLRYRLARFNNRTKPKGWLAPSLQHRVDTIISWVEKLRKLVPVTALSQELVRFDMQQMEDPEVSGVGYQNGTLVGYEVREYLLEKWGRKCAYCGAEHIPLEIDHIHPRSRGGSDRVSNLTIACRPCNQRKGSMDVREFLAGDSIRLARITTQARAPLRDAAAVNSTRWALYNRLMATGLEVEVSSGGRTKWNRHRLEIPKEHCLDAACVGHIDAIRNWEQPILSIKATGRGQYQRALLTKYGFPRGCSTRSKKAFGFQTGDMVKAIVTTGKKVGTYFGRVAIRAKGYFNINIGDILIRDIHHRFCTLVQRADGYGYSWTKIAST